MITISKTYEIITEESAEHGDAEERGFIFQDAEYTFRDLVNELIEFPVPSCWPGIPDWASSHEMINYSDGSVTIESIHPGNDYKSQKYWAKAWNYVYGK